MKMILMSVGLLISAAPSYTAALKFKLCSVVESNKLCSNPAMSDFVPRRM